MSSRTGLRGAAIIIGLSLSLNVGCDADAEGELALNAPADAGVNVQSDATSGTLDSSASSDASTAPENAIDAAVDGTEAPCGLASCVIEGSCVENLAANPDNPCQLCIVAISATEWSSADDEVCDDGDPCSADDRCEAGSCVGQIGTCDDGNPCTDDICEPDNDEALCTYAPIDGACDDGNACTDNDACVEGSCQGAAVQCDDDEPCFKSLCDPAIGCTRSFDDSQACDDGDACTTDDACAAGVCLGTGVICDDGNPCTADSCDAVSGECQFDPINAPCDDGNACTTNDACNKGQCFGEETPCPAQGPCFATSCDPTDGCSATPLSDVPCDDGDGCTVGDVCSAGQCTPGALKDCEDDNVCTIDACDAIEGCINESIADLCEDDNPCTNATCDAQLGCVFPPNSDPCDDNNLCTEGDTCTEGVCIGSPVGIDDLNPCTDDSCIPELGVQHIANTLPCDDGDACSLGDSCENTVCISGTQELACDDENGCTDDTCEAAAGCVFTPNVDPCDDGTACTDEDTCSEGECIGVEVDCDDGNACTADACSADSGCSNTVIVSNDCRPSIEVTFPPRAATLEVTGESILITGNVSSGAGGITSMTLNGDTAVDIDGDTFSVEFTPVVGGNTIVLDAIDELGSERKVVQAFHWAGGYTKPGTAIEKTSPGVGIFMSAATIDDGDRSLPPNDLATIFGIVFESFDINGLIGGDGPIAEVSGYKVFIEDFSDGGREIALAPTDGGTLNMAVTISNVTADVFLDSNSWFLPNVSGSIFISSIDINASVALSVVNNQLVADLNNLTVNMSDPDITLSNGLANFFLGWIADLLLGSYTDSLESAFVDTFADTLGPLLSSALSSLAFATTFEFPSFDPAGGAIPLNLATDFESVSCTSQGLELILRADVSTTPAIEYDNLGALRRLGCGYVTQTMTLPKTSGFEIAFADDTFNHLLWTAWRGGLMEFDVPPSLLGDVDLTALGVDEIDIRVSAMLAPVLSSCGGGAPKLHIGDLRIDASLNLFGTPMDVVMFASFTAGVEMSIDDGQLGLVLEDIEDLQSQIAIQQEDLIGSEALIASLIDDSLVPGLLGALGGGALGAFPLPEVPLTDELLGLPPGSIPPGTALGINPTGINQVDGNSYIEGELK